jgi:hypothetical protein
LRISRAWSCESAIDFTLFSTSFASLDAGDGYKRQLV